MLHPELGRTSEPLGTWQVDTDEIGEVIRLYAHHVDGAAAPEQAARRLGFLWKKLAGTPRLARLVLDYAEMRRQQAAALGTTRERGRGRLAERVLAAMGRPPRRSATTPPPSDVEGDRMYDLWLDG